jgi:GntR family transcriptional regulator, transcriptional repressor for pyruvate dehydrogenase complex
MDNKEDGVLSAISELIAADDYEIGFRLPSERELGSTYNVSRNTVRTALKTLEARGIIAIKGSSGSYLRRKPVISGTETADLNVSYREELKCLFEARRQLDPIVVSLSVQRMDAEDIKKLKLCLISLSQAIMQHCPDAVIAHDTSFRRVLAKSTKNRYFIEMTELLQLPPESIINLFSAASEEDKDILFAGYVELFNAFRDRNASSAGRAAESLLENIFAMLLAKDSSVN